ncbi:MAG: hypothetical protein ABIQ60_10820, partial [Burkholderiaceae bacterium]
MVGSPGVGTGSAANAATSRDVDHRRFIALIRCDTKFGVEPATAASCNSWSRGPKTPLIIAKIGAVTYSELPMSTAAANPRPDRVVVVDDDARIRDLLR